MIADKFSNLVKKRWDTWDRVTDVIIPLENKGLSVPPKCLTFLQPENGGTESCDIKPLEQSITYSECPTVPHVPREKYNAGKNETATHSFTSDEQEAAGLDPLPTHTEPPEPGSTAPFNQEALDAVKAGAGCWVWSGVLNEWLFGVRDEERKAKAIRRGIDPGGIWTLEELTGVQGMSPEGLRDVAKIKRQFGGTVQPGEVPARWRDALNPLEPVVAHRQDAGTVPYRLNIGGHTQLVWLSPGLETADVIQCAKVANPGVEVSNKPPPQGWPRLTDIPEIPKSGTPQPVEAWTPSGKRMIVTAYSDDHAAAIQRMNPPPASLPCRGDSFDSKEVRS